MEAVVGHETISVQSMEMKWDEIKLEVRSKFKHTAALGLMSEQRKGTEVETGDIC